MLMTFGKCIPTVRKFAGGVRVALFEKVVYMSLEYCVYVYVGAVRAVLSNVRCTPFKL